jgi:predicted DNA-binding transcriptional regulator AlpA
MRLIALDEMKAKTSLGKSAIYELIKDKKLPQPVKLGGASRWPEHEVDEALEKLAAAREPAGSPT